MAGGDRGLIATERIEADEVVVKVPLSAVIRLEAVAAASSPNNIVKEGLAGNYDENDQWAGVLAKKLWEESCQGTDSSWAPYIANLPTEAPLTPCRWNAQQQQQQQQQQRCRPGSRNVSSQLSLCQDIFADKRSRDGKDVFS